MTTPAENQCNAPITLQNVSDTTATAVLLDIIFSSECTRAPDASVVNDRLLWQWCQISLQRQTYLVSGAENTLEISVQLLDEPAMQSLNLKFRGKNTPTNVLSFASDMPVMAAQCASEHSAPDEQPALSVAAAGYLPLGDLVLCPAVIEREAAQQGKPLLHHWAHMLVHGTLHLCGYDHEQPGDAGTMESLEIQILSELGLPDPYLEQSV